MLTPKVLTAQFIMMIYCNIANSDVAQIALVERENEPSVNAIAWLSLIQSSPKMSLPTPGQMMGFTPDQDIGHHAFDRPLAGVEDDLKQLGADRIWYFLKETRIGVGIVKILIPTNAAKGVKRVLDDHFSDQRLQALRPRVQQEDNHVTIRFEFLNSPAVPALPSAKKAWRTAFRSQHCSLEGHGYMNIGAPSIWAREKGNEMPIEKRDRKTVQAVLFSSRSFMVIRSTPASLPKIVFGFEDATRAEKSRLLLRELAVNAKASDKLSIRTEDTEVIVEPVSSEGVIEIVAALRVLRPEREFRLP